jgi:hypothetical protein
MNRREFVRNLTLILGSAVAMTTEQTDAITRSLLLSSDHIPGNLVGIHEFVIGFDGVPSDRSMRLTLRDADRVVMTVALNQRATFRWVALPSTVLVTTADRCSWSVTGWPDGNDLRADVAGTIKWMDSDGRMRSTEMQGRDRL